MRRRDLLVRIGGAMVLRPLAAIAQQPAKRRLIATLNVGSQAVSGANIEIFRQALGTLGYGGAKIALENRYAGGHADRLPALAAELVRLSPDVLVASSGPAIQAAMERTTTIPIVFAISDDPVATGIVVSLARPGGNVTGLSFAGVETAGKELQLIKEMAPAAHRVAVLANPAAKTTRLILRALERAAVTLQIEVVAVEAGAPERIDPAFATIGGEHADALLVLGDGLFTSERKRIIALAASHRLPAIYHDHIFVEDGGLMSYGGDFADNYQGAAVLVARILDGAKPADLPVQEPTKFYLFINRGTAAALGLTIPALLEVQADKVIE